MKKPAGDSFTRCSLRGFLLYTQNANVVSGTVRAPNGDTLNLHDWSTDRTDYSKLMANAKTDAEFLKYAQERVNKANAQGIDISGNGSARSNADLYNTWYEKTGKSQPQSFGADQTLGYYGMDGSGHWGYYADQGLTQKLSNGGWDSYKASDGGYALFDSKNGYLWPSSVRDESRAGKTVTLAAGSKAFEVRYNANGYPVSVTNLNQTRGVNGNDLNLPTARSLNDQGISDRDLLRQTSGVGYTGPGSGVSFDDVRGATREDYRIRNSGASAFAFGFTNDLLQSAAISGRNKAYIQEDIDDLRQQYDAAIKALSSEMAITIL